ncbi:hypothetical protein ACXR8F_08445 [Terrabacter sp. AAH1]
MITDDFGPLTPDVSGPPRVFLLFFGLIFTLVIAGFVTVAVKGLSQWRANEASPLRTIDAIVVSRRTDVRRRPGSVGAPTDGSGTMSMASTRPSSSTAAAVSDVPSSARVMRRCGGPTHPLWFPSGWVTSEGPHPGTG